MPKSIKELTEERNKLLSQGRAILDKAESEGREKLNSEEAAEYAKIEADLDPLDDQIQSHEFAARKTRLATYDANAHKPLARQTESFGLAKNAGGDGATITVDIGRAGSMELSPDNPAHARGTDEYRRAFQAYLAYEKGDYRQLGLQVANDPKGGYLVPMATLGGLIKFLDDNVTMRKIATVLQPTSAKSVGMLSFDTDYADADWLAEVPASAITEDDASRFGKREMTPHLLTKLIKVSRKLLRSQTAIGLEAFISQRLGYKFAITENKGFLTGSGSQQPLGCFIASDDGIPTSRDITSSSATGFTADDIIDTEENCKDVYQARGSWLGSRGFRQRCRKLKDGTGNYLLRANGSEGGSAITTLNEHPLYVDENAPSTFTTGLYVGLFGDFSHYYIQDGLDMEIQRLDELLSLTNQVGWVARKETDGMPVLAEAFSRLKLGA